jgi:hypothetical protein
MAVQLTEAGVVTEPHNVGSSMGQQASLDVLGKTQVAVSGQQPPAQQTFPTQHPG